MEIPVGRDARRDTTGPDVPEARWPISKGAQRQAATVPTQTVVLCFGFGVRVFLVRAVLFLLWPVSGLACSTLCYFLGAVLKPMGRYVRGPACQAVLVHGKATSLGL